MFSACYLKNTDDKKPKKNLNQFYFGKNINKDF